MSAATDGGSGRGWRSRLAVPVAAFLALLCCLGAPFILGAVATLTAGAWLGVGVAAVALIATCVFAFTRVASSGRC